MTKGPPRPKEVVAKTKVISQSLAEILIGLKITYFRYGHGNIRSCSGSPKLQEFTADLQSESGRKNCFRIALLVFLPRPVEGMRRLQFSDLFPELTVPPQADEVVRTF